jgi:hypothetical protein
VMGLENKVIKIDCKHWNMNIIMLISMIILWFCLIQMWNIP